MSDLYNRLEYQFRVNVLLKDDAKPAGGMGRLSEVELDAMVEAYDDNQTPEQFVAAIRHARANTAHYLQLVNSA